MDRTSTRPIRVAGSGLASKRDSRAMPFPIAGPSEAHTHAWGIFRSEQFSPASPGRAFAVTPRDNRQREPKGDLIAGYRVIRHSFGLPQTLIR